MSCVSFPQAIVDEWKQKYADDPTMYPVDRIRPTYKPGDPNISGLVIGNKGSAAASNESEAATATAAPAAAVEQKSE